MPLRTLRDWGDGEFVPDGVLNRQIRDNMLTLKTIFNDSGQPVFAWKAGFQTSTIVRNNSTTLTDLTGVQFTVGSYQTWAFLFLSMMQCANATSNAKWALSAPQLASADIIYGIIGPSAGVQRQFTITLGLDVDLSVAPVTPIGTLFGGVIATRAGGGAVQVQAAQDTAVAANTSFFEYSPWVAARLL